MRAVLTYHSIDSSGSAVSLEEPTFRRHVRWLAASGVRVVPLEELLRLPPSADAVALTFDDGFANFAEVAWPLLRDHGMPATLFVVTDFVGRSNGWRAYGRALPQLPLLDWTRLGRLAEAGVQVGSHSRTHPDLRSLSASALAEELEGSASLIRDEIGTKPRTFAYPYGWFDEAVVTAVRAVYAVACTTELRSLRQQEDPCRIPRLDAYYLRRPGRLEAWGTAWFQAHLWLRAGARRVRGTLAAPHARTGPLALGRAGPELPTRRASHSGWTPRTL